MSTPVWLGRVETSRILEALFGLRHKSVHFTSTEGTLMKTLSTKGIGSRSRVLGRLRCPCESVRLIFLECVVLLWLVMDCTCLPFGGGASALSWQLCGPSRLSLHPGKHTWCAAPCLPCRWEGLGALRQVAVMLALKQCSCEWVNKL